MVAQMLKHNKSRRETETGFSLTELMIAVVILGILAAIAIPIFSNQQKEALKQEVREDLTNTVSSLSQWQLTQDEMHAVPSADRFNKLKVVTTPSQTNIVNFVYNPTDPENRQVCVEATRNIGGEIFRISFNQAQSTVVEAACAPIAVQQETYG